jgi:hypothetical protein
MRLRWNAGLLRFRHSSMDERKGALSREPEFDPNQDAFCRTAALVMKEELSFQEFPKSRSTVKQAVVLLATGLVLSAGSCAGFLDTAKNGGAIARVFAVGFVAGVLLMIGTFVWAVVRAARDD